MNTATTFTALYEGGVLRPSEPLPFDEGTKVDVIATVSRDSSVLSEAEAIRRIESAKTVEEWAAAANAPTDSDDEYDLMKALDENRRLSGDYRMLSATDSQNDDVQ